MKSNTFDVIILSNGGRAAFFSVSCNKIFNVLSDDEP